MRGQKKKKEKHQNCRGPSQSWAWSIGPRDKAQSMGLGFPFPPFYLLRCTHSLSDSIHSSSSHSSLASMALLAVHAMAASPATFPSSHHHAAVSSYCALPAAAAFSRSRSRVAAAAAATLSAPLTPVLEGNWHAYLTSLSLFCSSIRISLVWNWLDDLIWNCFSNRIARIQLIQHQNIDWNKNLAVWTNYDSNSNYSIWCDQFTAGEGTRRPRGEKGSTTRTEMWVSSTKIKLIKKSYAYCFLCCCLLQFFRLAICWLLFAHLRRGRATRRRELALHGCSRRLRLRGRTSSTTARSPRSTSTMTSWNRLSEFPPLNYGLPWAYLLSSLYQTLFLEINYSTLHGLILHNVDAYDFFPCNIYEWCCLESFFMHYQLKQNISTDTITKLSCSC